MLATHLVEVDVCVQQFPAVLVVLSQVYAKDAQELILLMSVLNLINVSYLVQRQLLMKCKKNVILQNKDMYSLLKMKYYTQMIDLIYLIEIAQRYNK